ncbi:MAG: glycosyltransferase family A protein [Gallionella sp.]|jgi:hypothetical protein
MVKYLELNTLTDNYTLDAKGFESAVIVGVSNLESNDIVTYKAVASTDPQLLRDLYQMLALTFDSLTINTSDNLMVDLSNYYHLLKPGGTIIVKDYNSDAMVEEFLSQDTFLKSNNDLIIRKARPLTTPVGLVFGIVMATYDRRDFNLITATLTSLRDQQYQGWHLFLVGDRHTDEVGMREVLQRLLPTEKVTFINLPIACERDFMPKSLELWHTGGATVMNYSLALMREYGYQHTAHLDDDDIWRVHHLQILANRYTMSPELSFVSTRGLYGGGGVIAGSIDPHQVPRGGTSLHSSISWNLNKVTLRYRTGDSYRGRPADADFLNEIGEICRVQSILTYACKNVTIEHPVEGSAIRVDAPIVAPIVAPAKTITRAIAIPPKKRVKRVKKKAVAPPPPPPIKRTVLTQHSIATLLKLVVKLR